MTPIVVCTTTHTCTWCILVVFNIIWVLLVLCVLSVYGLYYLFVISLANKSGSDSEHWVPYWVTDWVMITQCSSRWQCALLLLHPTQTQENRGRRAAVFHTDCVDHLSGIYFDELLIPQLDRIKHETLLCLYVCKVTPFWGKYTVSSPGRLLSVLTVNMPAWGIYLKVEDLFSGW